MIRVWRGWRWRQRKMQLGSRKYSSLLEQGKPIPQDFVHILEKRMSSIEHRFAQLSTALLEPEIVPDEVAKVNKELSSIRPAMDVITILRNKQNEIETLKALLKDPSQEMREMASEDLQCVMNDVTDAQRNVLVELLPKDEDDSRGCILEVRAGAGGDEASLFAMDLFKMYERYAQKNCWDFEVIDITLTDTRGYKEASASVTGDQVYGKLKFESGVHRVQRVPTTEKSGRIHTSTASVAILPEANEIDVQVRNDDLRIDFFRSSGAGGQHVNTTSSAVRVTHIPTNTVVSIQDARSQHKNKAKALQILYARLYALERSRTMSSRSELRQELIGSGDRSERIRTYNFPQGRVTDHRVGITQHSIEQIMQGDGLDTFFDALKMKEEADALASLKASA